MALELPASLSVRETTVTTPGDNNCSGSTPSLTATTRVAAWSSAAGAVLMTSSQSLSPSPAARVIAGFRC